MLDHLGIQYINSQYKNYTYKYLYPNLAGIYERPYGYGMDTSFLTASRHQAEMTC